MPRDSLSEWTELLDQFGELGAEIHGHTKDMQGESDDPAIVGAILFNRAWGHFRSFSLLWRNRLSLDADVVLRNCCEAAICLANLEKRPADFIADLRSDAAHTLERQIAMWKTIKGTDDLVRNAERHLTEIFGAGQPNSKKFNRLDLSSLAKQADADILYRFYQSTSGMTAHITGLSLLFHVAEDGSAEALALHNQRREKQRAQSVMSMCIVGGVAMHASCRLLSLSEIGEAERLALIGQAIGRRDIEEDPD